MKELQDKIKDFPHAIENAGDAGLRPLAVKTVSGIQSQIHSAPRVDLGKLVEGIHFKKRVIRNGIQYTIKPSKSTDRYAIFVEEDTRPHFPPIQALQGWADRHDIPVYAVAQKIARDGTRGIGMVDKEFNTVISNAQKTANKIGERLVIELRWGQS